MGDVRVAAGLDRLPWLADEPQTRALPRKRRRMWPLWLAASLAALIVIAGAAYWLGTRSSPVEQSRAAIADRPPVTVPLPAPVMPPPLPQVAIEPLPQVEPVAAPPPPVTREVVPRKAVAERQAVRPVPRAKAPIPRAAPAAPAKSKTTATKPSAALPIWPVRVETQSAGRLVRVGTFATPREAKRGWTKIMRFYPGMKRLPALAVPIRAVPSGRQYYRLQMGTTSQAHSEVLCQRMRIIGVSCVVLDIGTRRR